jgi:hypothetical protein
VALALVDHHPVMAEHKLDRVEVYSHE